MRAHHLILRSGFVSLVMLGLCAAANALPSCELTNAVAAKNYPGAEEIPQNNNLLLPTGKAVAAPGQQVTITGYLRDRHCLPVTDAVVELWQVNPFGHWVLAGEEDLASPNPIFAGAGRTVSDKEGRFRFITAFPGETQVKTGQKGKAVTTAIYAPRVQLRVKAPAFKPFATTIFFGDDRRNAQDPVYKTLKPSQREAVTLHMDQDASETLTGEINLTLDGKAPYRTY